VLQTLKEDILSTPQLHFNVGIIGAKYLWPILNQNGMKDIAWSLATKTTFPSFGYWISKGATTLREQWDGQNSQNHQMFGSVDEYFYKYLAGIQSPSDGKTTKGYKHIHIQPYIPEKLSFAEASVNTVAGKVESRWEHAEGELRLKVSIPANSDATICIPLILAKKPLISENGKTVWQNGQYVPGVPGISGATQEKNYIMVNVGSGHYEFNLTELKH